MTSAKSYWSTLKMLFNDKKIPSVSPLRYQNNYEKAFNKKSEIFNSLFAEQSSLIN